MVVECAGTSRARSRSGKAGRRALRRRLGPRGSSVVARPPGMLRTAVLPLLAALTLAGCGGGGAAAGGAGATTPGQAKTPGAATPSATTSATGACVPPAYGTTSGTLTIVTQSCPAGTQGQPYAGCTVTAQGGVPPYTFSVTNSLSYPTLPEGMSIASCNGQISSSYIGGQGYYEPQIVVTDAAGNRATRQIGFSIAGNNAFLENIFPSTSIFHHRVDSLPVDTSPAAPIPSVYASTHIRVFFGNTSGAPFPNGIPALSVPAAQPDVAVATTQYQSYFSSGPIPSYAPIEGTAESTGDRHVIVYRQGTSGQAPSLYELWQGINKGSSGWSDSSNALWSDTTSNALTPQGGGTADAAGLPVGPLLVTADEVIGSGTPAAPNGVIRHPIRFTLNHMLNYWVWPATASAGVGSCYNGATVIPVRELLSQTAPPTSCTSTAPAGEIYRLKSTVATPSCAATSPQAAIIITGMRNYGIILADNGLTGGIIGTPDSRWNDSDLACLSQLTLADFEPVNVSSLMKSGPGSGQAQ